MAEGGVEDALAGDGVDAAAGKGGPHGGEVRGRDREAALPGVDIQGKVRIAAEPTPAVQEEGQRPVDVVGGGGRGVHLLVELERAAREGGESGHDRGPLLLALAGHEARGGDGAGVDHRVGAPVAFTLHCGDGVERQPRGVHADPGAGLLRTERLEDEGEHERLGDAHEGEGDVHVASRVDGAARPDDAHPEVGGVRCGEGGVHAGELAVGHVSEALVCLGDDLPDGIRRGQATG